MPGIFGWLKEFVKEYDRGTSVMRGRSPQPDVSGPKVPPEDGIESGVELSGDRAIVSVKLPDVRRDDIDLTLSRRHVLTVSGLVRSKEEATDEMDFGAGLRGFREEITLPSGFEDSVTGASLEDGVLKITFARSGSEEDDSLRVPLQDVNG